MGSGIYGEIDQEREVLPGSKANRVAVWSEECRMTQAAEIPSRLHKHRVVRGFQSMRPDKHSVNSALCSPSSSVSAARNANAFLRIPPLELLTQLGM